MDLKNLNDELKFGKVLKETPKALTLITPLARFAFPTLDEPEQFKGEGAFRYSVDLIFETDSTREGCVDFKNTMLPAIVKFAQSQGVAPKKIEGEGIALGKSQGHDYLAIHTGQRVAESGEPYDGYEKSSIWLKVNRKPKIQHPPWPGVIAYSPTGKKNFPVSEIYGGCWGRVVLQAYRPKGWGMIAFAFQSIQKIADGEPFGADGLVHEMSGIEGAEETSDMDRALQEPSAGLDADYADLM